MTHTPAHFLLQLHGDTSSHAFDTLGLHLPCKMCSVCRAHILSPTL